MLYQNDGCIVLLWNITKSSKSGGWPYMAAFKSSDILYNKVYYMGTAKNNYNT